MVNALAGKLEWSDPAVDQDLWRIFKVDDQKSLKKSLKCMGLKGSMFMYLQFTDLVFGPVPAGLDCDVALSITGDHRTLGFCPFVDNHNTGVDTFA